jgi:ribosomal protein S18 acetylase RimI-like enzyme
MTGMINKNQIDYSVVVDSNDELLIEAAQLHIEHLSYRSFITLFGTKFILELYKDILSDKLGFFVFALSGNKVCGFVLGCMDSSRLFKLIIKKFPKYLKKILPQIISKPKLIPKLFETLFYVKKENTDIVSELVVIVTDSDYRTVGIGSGLVEILNKEFLKRGLHQYKVTVHDEMKQSNNFYVKNGMKLSTSFMMYNMKWNLYINQLD